MRTFSLLAAGTLAVASLSAACSGPDAAGEASSSVEDDLSSNPNAGYFVVTRQDPRICPAPMCGGVFVKRVNDASTRCADGTFAAECYVGAVDYSNLGLSAQEASVFEGRFTQGKALIRSQMASKTIGGKLVGKLVAAEAWDGATDSAVPAGATFYRAAQKPIACIQAPCPTIAASELNSQKQILTTSVQLLNTARPASRSELAQATKDLGAPNGILVVGALAFPPCATTPCGSYLNADEFYLRVSHQSSLGAACGGRGGAACGAGQFCEWKLADICGAADAQGHCAYKPDFCTDDVKPVCGCDGRTYTNTCVAASVGVSVAANGPCGM